MSSLPSPQESPRGLNRANVIKWTEALPRARNRAAAPVPHAAQVATFARRRQRRIPGPPPGSWPLPGSRPTCPLPDPALAQLCTVPDPAPPYDDDVQASPLAQESRNADTRFAGGRRAQAGPAPHSQAGPAPHSQAGPGPHSQAGPAPHSQAGPAPHSQAGPGPHSQAGPGPHSQAGSGPPDGLGATVGRSGSGTSDRPGDGHRQNAGGRAGTQSQPRYGTTQDAGHGEVAHREPGPRRGGGAEAAVHQEAAHREAAHQEAAHRADAGLRAAGDSPAGPTWPSQFAQVLAETLAGSRPPRQLTPWTTERARSHIRRLGPLLATTQEPRIRRIVASTPSNGVVEMAVVVRFGPRVHALALRLERGEGAKINAWQCTAIEAA